MGSTSLLFLASPSISHPKSKDTRSVNTADSISSSIPGTKLTCTPPNATATRARHCPCQCVVSSWRSGRGRCPLGYGDERAASRSRSHGVHTHRIVSRRIPAYGTRMPNRPQARCHWSSQPACCSRARYLLGSWSLRADPLLFLSDADHIAAMAIRHRTPLATLAANSTGAGLPR